MEKIRIITDSTADITAPFRENITVLPMRINFGNEEYLDGVTINHYEFYEKLLQSDVLPVTSLIAPLVFEEAYEKAVSAGEKVIVITVSSKLSGTYQSAVLAAQRFEGDVFVIDSLNATIGEQILVTYALQLIDSGMALENIIVALEASKKQICTLGLLDTLEYLQKGGRISKTTAFVGGILSIKPIVAISDGEVIMLGKVRGARNGNHFLSQEIDKAGGIDFNKPFCLGYTGLEDSSLKKYIQDSEALWHDYHDELPMCSVGATIGTHVGPNAIAIAFFIMTKS